MKKLLAMLLALIMTAMIPAVCEVTEEYEPEYVTLQGFVTEISGEYVMIETEEFGSVQANLSADTVFVTELTLSEGQYATVTYDGMMARSLPPQVNAIVISNYRMIGKIISVNVGMDAANDSLTIFTDLHGEVIVHLPENVDSSEYEEGDMVLVYNDGAMTMSLPPQIGAQFIMKLFPVSGIVSDVQENSIMIETENGEVQVNLSADTEGLSEFENGAAVTVYYNGMMTRSLIPQITAVLITVPVR